MCTVPRACSRLYLDSAESPPRSLPFQTRPHHTGTCAVDPVRKYPHAAGPDRESNLQHSFSIYTMLSSEGTIRLLDLLK